MVDGAVVAAVSVLDADERHSRCAAADPLGAAHCFQNTV